MTFPAGEPHRWDLFRNDDREVDFAGIEVSTGECKNGSRQAYGIFKSQGDCISYVATGGKNPPSGA